MMWIAILVFFIIFSVLILFTVGILSIVIKTPIIRVFVAFLIWAVILGNLGVHDVPRWKFQQFTFKRHLELIYPALILYKKDHENTFPEHLSQLIPDYIPQENLNFFLIRTRLVFSDQSP